MVDFGKRLAQKHTSKPQDPSKVYDLLDRASDKGPLRPAQVAILSEWHSKRRDDRDTIVKLHTGQGKTLIGLLMLQSKLNENNGAALYLCPNNFLADQTCEQARQFGVKYCTPDDDLPFDFIEGKSVLVTTVHKLFNGLTKFHLDQNSQPVSTVLMDDCHACIDVIRNCFTIKLARENPIYQQILALFKESLDFQGAGTLIDIQNGNGESFLPVPYWKWQERHAEVLAILGKHTDQSAVKFPWPLLRNSLSNCQCIISGQALEIAPYLAPLERFGSYDKAKTRIFMSATVTDDSFLVKGLRLPTKAILNPLVFKDEKWSGEKMILIPSMIDERLTRAEIMRALAPPQKGRRIGIISLVPSFDAAKPWEALGATIAKTETINDEVNKLKAGNREKTLVIVNRYDGIDLPDDSCRILIFDSKPYSDNLIDRYSEWCRPLSELTAMRAARSIEQGLGRSVRGEKDYSVIILLGTELIKMIRNQATRHFLSNQTRQQITIGLEIVEMSKEEKVIPIEALTSLDGLIEQCLGREDNWKAFYFERMETLGPSSSSNRALDIFSRELDAEIDFQNGNYQMAIDGIQVIINNYASQPEDKGWYFQEMARYNMAVDQAKSNSLQIEAHVKNRFLLKPRTGMKVDRLEISQKRMAKIISWIRIFEDYEEMNASVEDTLGRLEFGVKAESFELGLNELGKALGFACDRPDKQWKEGPDNLWGIQDDTYLLIECKNEVLLNRTEIDKAETGQMNNACAWFTSNYPGAKVACLMIIPTNMVSHAAGFNLDVTIMSEKELKELRINVRKFFDEFKQLNLQDLSEAFIQNLINGHKLSNDDLLKAYSRPARRKA